MKLDEYIVRGGQKLRLGYTTGSCAAAAAKAAAWMLVTGEMLSCVSLRTPKGPELLLELEDIRFDYDTGGQKAGERRLPLRVSCAVRKDSGDDPDITNQTLIYAEVSRSSAPGIRIDGGEGVGRVTKPGLDQPVGNAAINSTPRRMIEEAVREAVRAASDRPAVNAPVPPGDSRVPAGDSTASEPPAPEGESLVPDPKIPAAFGDPDGFDVILSVPGGRELAARTFNPKLGIEGGISILGTSGIVEPMSERALLDAIRVEIRVRKEEGRTVLALVPGNYGKNFFLETYGFSLDTAVTSSNFIYDTVQMAAEAGFTRLLFTGHIGKLVKIAGGVRNTHSKYGDRRMEILTEITEEILRKGQEFVTDPRDPQEGGDLREMLAACVTTDEAVRVLRERGLDRAVLTEMTRRIQTVMQAWTGGKVQVEVIVFSNRYGELGRTDRALEYMHVLREEGGWGEKSWDLAPPQPRTP